MYDIMNINMNGMNEVYFVQIPGFIAALFKRTNNDNIWQVKSALYSSDVKFVITKKYTSIQPRQESET